ncbi:UNVERIFIED_ORG: integrase [Rhizobium esperanzae]
MAKLLATCIGDSLHDIRDRAIMMVAFASGGRRRSELAGLRKEQLTVEPLVKAEDRSPLTFPRPPRACDFLPRISGSLPPSSHPTNVSSMQCVRSIGLFYRHAHRHRQRPTIDGFWSPSATFPQPKPRSSITPCWTNQPWLHNLNQTASGKPGAVHTT